MTEVAHDIQQQVSRFITTDLSLVNSYDTWHGIHNIYMQCMCTHFMYTCVYACGRHKECLEAAAEDYTGQSERQRCDLVS